MSAYTNKPKILRGAFVEYGLSMPPLVVPFQYNPEQLSRNRGASFRASGATPGKKDGSLEMLKIGGTQTTQHNLKKLHQRNKDVKKAQEEQEVDVEEETISLDIRFDATDRLNDGDPLTEQFGIAPQLAALEQMLTPKSEGEKGALIGGGMVEAIGGAVEMFGGLLGGKKAFSYTKEPKPPLMLFVWGRKRVLPVNITSMNIKELQHSADLNPVRAEVSISMTVIEGKNPFYQYSRMMRGAMSTLNYFNVIDIHNVIIPG